MTASVIRPTTIKIDQDTKERMQRLADARQRTPHWMILDAIRQYVDREEKREAFRQDGIKAWREYQETGLHLTGDEVIAWLDTWGEENEAAVPACHK
ncbi:MAG: CopG family ribbon-helix-helix protein [Stenotrophobium sp.]